MKGKNRGFGIYLIVLLMLMGVAGVLFSQSKPQKTLYSEVYDYFINEKVTEFAINGNQLTAKLKDNTVVQYDIPSQYHYVFQQDLGEIIAQQHKDGVIGRYDYIQPAEMPWWSMFVPYLVLMLIFGLFWYFMFSKSDKNSSGGASSSRGAMGFGKSRAKLAGDEHKKVMFKDVAGADEEKAELEEIVGFLKDPKKFLDLGARIPHGVLLIGPPGTGKTLIAKAVAGEAGVPFLTISGSDFVELYVGVGASRVRDLFEQAKKNSPAIVFIDEIDAVGRHRGAGLGGGHDEREQTLNQLLVEMDGFSGSEGVIIIAATNRPDILDPALLRPGRFDRQVYVGYPDIRGRREILEVHAKNKRFGKDVSFESIAKTTAGFTGAELENLLNESALLAARQDKKQIDLGDIEKSFLKVIMGTEKKSRVITEKERKLTAYHEAGHAVITRLMQTQDPVHQISIIPRGRAGGFTMSLPKEDKYYSSKNEMLESIMVLLGGRVAEKLVLDDISTGASNDIERSTKTARAMVTKYGMSDRIGPINYVSEHEEVFLGKDFNSTKTISEVISSQIDQEIKAIIDSSYEKCAELLTEHMKILTDIAEYLIRNETMDGETFEKMFNGEEVIESSPSEISNKPDGEDNSVDISEADTAETNPDVEKDGIDVQPDDLSSDKKNDSDDQ